MIRSDMMITIGLRKFFVLMLGLYCLFFDAKAQPLPLDDNIYTGIIDFLTTHESLEHHNSIAEYRKRLYLFEIGREELLDSKRDGIYTFGINSSGTKGFVLILIEGKWKIYDMKDMVLLLSDACVFFSKNKLTQVEIVKYTNGILKAFEYNNKY